MPEVSDKYMRDPETGRVRRCTAGEADLLDDYGWTPATEAEERTQSSVERFRQRGVRS